MIGIASDHAGYEVKQKIIDFLEKNNYKVIDYGTNKGKTHGELLMQYSKNYYINKCNDYGIEVSESNVKYIIENK